MFFGLFSAKPAPKRRAQTSRAAKPTFSASAYVKERKANGTPLQIIWNELMAMNGELKVMEAAMKGAERIEGVLVTRNLKGKDYEKAGDERRAITQYEANVKDQFNGSHPYERLRVIYTRMGRIKDVVRVCQAYIDHGQQGDEKGKAKYAEVIANLTQVP